MMMMNISRFWVAIALYRFHSSSNGIRSLCCNSNRCWFYSNQLNKFRFRILKYFLRDVVSAIAANKRANQTIKYKNQSKLNVKLTD